MARDRASRAPLSAWAASRSLTVWAVASIGPMAAPGAVEAPALARELEPWPGAIASRSRQCFLVRPADGRRRPPDTAFP